LEEKNKEGGLGRTALSEERNCVLSAWVTRKEGAGGLRDYPYLDGPRLIWRKTERMKVSMGEGLRGENSWGFLHH